MPTLTLNHATLIDNLSGSEKVTPTIAGFIDFVKQLCNSSASELTVELGIDTWGDPFCEINEKHQVNLWGHSYAHCCSCVLDILKDEGYFD